MSQYFHFSLGPVQSFVAQARRTRDFWAGSFLLSWLSAVAMRAVEEQKGNIIFPKPDVAFINALIKGEKGPEQGSIPNRFKARVPETFRGKAVKDCVDRAWRELASQVFRNDLAEIARNSITQDIWNRQIRYAWEIVWALTEDDDNQTINNLKLWRRHLMPDEPGVKCMLMDGWQELSGSERPGKAVKEFWQKVRLHSPQSRTLKTDLRENECLCALAFVKRRFVHIFKDFRVDMDNGWTVHGWSIRHGVPNVDFIAAAPWLSDVIRKTKENPTLEKLLWEFHKDASNLCGQSGDRKAINIHCITEALSDERQHDWTLSNGAVFFDAMLENNNLWGEKNSEARALLQALKNLRKEAGCGPVSPFYAILLMDGDELGIHMGDSGKQGAIACSLAAFTEAVNDIVYRHNGFLVYAGGDDVLALLPLEFALSCALAIRKKYQDCFSKSAEGDPIQTSISAAIEFVHIKMPLGKVLADAHQLLDTVAKDGRGRDAIACRVWKPGGLHLEWAMPWESAFPEKGLDEKNLDIESLAENLCRTLQTTLQTLLKEKQNKNDRQSITSVQGAHPNSFFFKLHEYFALFNPPESRFIAMEVASDTCANQPPLAGDEVLISLLTAEYLNSGFMKTKSREEIEAFKQSNFIPSLLAQCRPVFRQKDKPPKQWPKSSSVHEDGALLLRFLASKGMEPRS